MPSSPSGREPLSRERVLAAAVRLADAHGTKAVTMRRLADDLACEAMSLYHYVESKQALLAGMAETVIAEIVAALPGQDAPDWRQDLRDAGPCPTSPRWPSPSLMRRTGH